MSNTSSSPDLSDNPMLPEDTAGEVASAVGSDNYPLSEGQSSYPTPPSLEAQLRDAIVGKQREIERFRQVADLLAGDPEFVAKYEVLQSKLREL